MPKLNEQILNMLEFNFQFYNEILQSFSKKVFTAYLCDSNFNKIYYLIEIIPAFPLKVSSLLYQLRYFI